MTISQWLVEAMIKLKDADIPNGRTDALVLLSDQFGVDKSWIHSHPEDELDDLQIRELNRKLQKRLDHVPLAYIRGFKEFYGRSFMVNSNVLIPRPESESFIDLIKSLEFETARILDIGTGSGCIGITAGLELTDAAIHLSDISSETLAVAQHNAQQYGLEVTLIESDLLRNIPDLYDIVLANLPYVPNHMITSQEITKEPRLALFSGDDGLDHYRKFWPEVTAQYVLTESLESQHKAVEELAMSAGYKLLRTDVLVQMFCKQ